MDSIDFRVGEWFEVKVQDDKGEIWLNCELTIKPALTKKQQNMFEWQENALKPLTPEAISLMDELVSVLNLNVMYRQNTSYYDNYGKYPKKDWGTQRMGVLN
jgi:hypothetical protein